MKHLLDVTLQSLGWKWLQTLYRIKKKAFLFVVLDDPPPRVSPDVLAPIPYPVQFERVQFE